MLPFSGTSTSMTVAAILFSASTNLELPPVSSFQLRHPPRVRALIRHRSCRSYDGTSIALRLGTGLTFTDGDQILVSAQKPLGIVLEEREEGGMGGGCVVAEISDPRTSAVAQAGVQPGDMLIAVQNADVGSASIEEVLQRIAGAPKVVNLRFQKAG
mmetsp:Transcript_35586/g.72157  ORF Transcript_35586/g.72157 Transcript_35586/m.72157 type:complete len:157 (+) Transcript_35586:452-922(+)